ncbi:hypothetical protein WJX84_001985 [Apatococcus fuscideae]|uniref:Uncharacterized protein n=1 Tax=Apatococcus fuscideae TaxID=2026836 RepID=A0AAW1T694_9CHLO
MLVTHSGALCESFYIVQWAEARSCSGLWLFPQGFTSEIAEWEKKGDAMSACSRNLLITQGLEDEAVLNEYTCARWHEVAGACGTVDLRLWLAAHCRKVS